MGGQACILYGAAEFSKDIDFALLADEENLACLNKALTDLDEAPERIVALQSRKSLCTTESTDDFMIGVAFEVTRIRFEKQRLVIN